MCKRAHVILCTVLSQNFHFCCFRAMAYIRVWNWVHFCLLNTDKDITVTVRNIVNAGGMSLLGWWRCRASHVISAAATADDRHGRRSPSNGWRQRAGMQSPCATSSNHNADHGDAANDTSQESRCRCGRRRWRQQWRHGTWQQQRVVCYVTGWVLGYAQLRGELSISRPALIGRLLFAR